MNLLLFNLSVDRDDAALAFTTDWINELAKHFDSVSVITMFAGRVEVSPNVTVLSAGREKRYSKPIRVLEFYRLLLHVLATRHIDVCFAHMMPLFAVFAWPILRLRSIPTCLWYAHNHPSRMLKIANWLVDVPITSVSSAYPVRNQHLQVVGQGIDTTVFKAPASPHAGTPFVFYTIGRISAVKRLEVLIEAFRQFKASRPNASAELHIVGDRLSATDRAYHATLAEAVKSSGMEPLVHFKSSIPFHEIPAAHACRDVFLHANDNGLDKALLEAMACANPVIAFHPAVADAIGTWAARVPEDIAARMARLYDLPAGERREIGQAHRQYIIDHHSLSALGGRIAGILAAIKSAPKRDTLS